MVAVKTPEEEGKGNMALIVSTKPTPEKEGTMGVSPPHPAFSEKEAYSFIDVCFTHESAEEEHTL